MTVGELIATLQTLPTDEPVEWTTGQLEDHLPVIVALEARTAALRLEALAAYDATQAARSQGFRSTADWLTKTTGISHAGAIVKTARALRDQLPATAHALATGQITEDHVAAIRRAHRMFGDDFTTVEAAVVNVAVTSCVKDLSGFIDRIIQQYQPDASDAATTTATLKRRLHLSASLDGWWHLTGLLDPETGQRLQAALDVYADPTGPTDTRTPEMRRADAMAEIADKALTGINRPTGRGQIIIRLTAEQMTTGLGVQWPAGALMTRADVDKLTCSTTVTTVLGIDTPTGWQPVNVGTTQRFATRAQRAALETRDGPTCIAEGCTVPTNRTIAHHLTHWNRGGRSDINNYALVCGCHHNDAHHNRLQLVIKPDGSYTLTRRRN
ncbi:MAG: DUF222 domain-containing protein [Candidatus Nanopelagicales bacterium]